MKHAQIEIMGLLVIIIVLVIAGLTYLTFSLSDTDPSQLSPAEQRYLNTFTTVLSATNSCSSSTETVADTAAAHLYNRDITCATTSVEDHLNKTLNETILPETLDYQFGADAYTLRITSPDLNNTMTYRGCPPLSVSDRRAATQPVYTDYGTLTITLTLCND